MRCRLTREPIDTASLLAGEVLIGTSVRDGRTIVRASTSRLHGELSRFLMTIAPAAEEVRQSLPGPGTSGAG